MKHPLRSALRLALIAAASAPLALAQDSVSKLSALPGDALDPYNAAEQLNDYVVDQATLVSTGGKVFGIAPIAKASAQRNTLPTFFTSGFSAQNMSRRVATNVPFLRGSYSHWTAAGFGVNDDPARNDPGTPINTVGATGFQFGFGFSEFGDGNPSGTSLNNMIGGIANFRSARPSRLFVSRITAATGGSNEGCALASFGAGGVDEEGNLHFRADSNLTTNLGCPAFVPVTGNNLFRVRMASRASTLNVLSGSFPTGADAGATDHLLAASTTTHNCPNIIPRSIATRPILMVGNAPTTPPGSYVFEQVAGSVTTAAPGAHLAGSADQRGGIAYSTHNFPVLFAGSVSGTGGVLGYNAGQANALTLWGLDANGGFLAPVSKPLPAVITDPDQPSWSNTVQPGTFAFDHYHGATLFRAAPSQVAIGRDQSGNLLAAGVVYYGGIVNNDPNCFIAVAKTHPTTGATTWSVAAWTSNSTSSFGKNVYQNGTTVIGSLRPFGVLGGLGATGPTQSAPMIDSVGNIWFIGSFELAATPGTTQVGLLRAVYQPASFSYKIELVVKSGDVFPGRNSGRNYRIGFIPLAGTTTISIDTAWSGNITEGAFQNQSAVGLNTADAATLGGLVFRASITYDVNGDNAFNPASTTAGSPDEDYQVLMYVSPSQDCNGNGLPDDADIGDGTESDNNGNGIPDSCEGGIGSPFCAGDGSGTPCPCANHSAVGANLGCLNSLGVGAGLTATGSSSLANDTVVLHGVGMPNASALYFQGLNQQAGGSGTAFGDGKRCAGGSIVRLLIVQNVNNMSQYPSGAQPSVSVRGMVGAPGIRTYQTWYRNAANFCTVSTFNLSNGLQLTWVP